MVKRKKIVLSLILFVIVYCGLYYYKIIRYSIYDSSHPFGREDSYIFNKFYSVKGIYPNTEEDLRKFLRDNPKLFEGNVMAEYLRNYSFHIKYDERKRIFYIYEDGPNYRDDNFSAKSDFRNTNLFNYLFRDGDVLLLYFSEHESSPEILIDKNIELPKNIKITTDTL